MKDWFLFRFLLPWIYLSPCLVRAIPLLDHGSGVVPSFRGNGLQKQVLSPAFRLLPRFLAAEDYQAFLELLEGAVISLPDFSASQRVLFATFNMDATNIECFDIVLKDMEVAYNQVSNQKITFTVDVSEIDLTCTMDFEYTYGFIRGRGTAQVTSYASSAKSQLAFTSQDFDLYPPDNSTEIEVCEADISVDDIVFSGSVSSAILSVFESIIADYIETETQALACEEIGSIITSLLDGFLNLAQSYIEPHLLPIAPEYLDPLIGEEEMVVPSDVTLINFRDTETSHQWFLDALLEVDSTLGAYLVSDISPRPDGKDLAINVLLRDWLLDSDRALTMTKDELPRDYDPVLYSGEDRFMNATVTLESLRVFGLDTLTKFEAFQYIGNYTIQTEINWDNIVVEADLAVELRPSTLDDSIFAESNPDVLVEEMLKVTFGIDNVTVLASVLMAIDEDKFGSMQIGPLFNSSNLIECLFSTVHDSQITGLQAFVGDVRDPELSGFVDAGINEMATVSLEAFFLMYEATVLKALPSVFETEIRGLFNRFFFETYQGDCPTISIPSTFVDYRDFFLADDESRELGGTGTEPYGDLSATLSDFLKQQIESVESDGSLSANTMFIHPLTRMQSGIKGMFHFPQNLYSLQASEVGGILGAVVPRLGVKISDLKVYNVDTLMPPIEVLEPTADEFHLSNDLNFGPISNRQINVSSRVLITLDGEDYPFSDRNELEVSFAADSMELAAVFSAMMSTMALLRFPLSDMLDINCWIATIPPPVFYDNGTRVPESGLNLESSVARIRGLSLNVACYECSDPTIALLPDLVGVLEYTRVVEVLGDRIDELVNAILRANETQDAMDQLLKDAPYACPHKPEYNGTNATILLFDGLPKLSDELWESLELIGAVAAELAFVIFTENQRLMPVEPGDPLEPQQNFIPPANAQLVNFSESFGLGLPDDLLIDDIELSGLSDFLGSQVEDASTENGTDLGVNLAMRTIFGDDAVFSLKFKDLSFGDESYMLKINSFEIEGLDTFTECNVFQVLGPQTLQNQFAMENIGFSVNLTFGVADELTDIAFGFSVADLNISLPIFAAIDVDRLSALQLGSLMFIEEIVPCFMSTVYEMVFPHMLVHVGSLNKPTVTGLDPQTDDAVNDLLDALFDNFGDQIEEALPSVFDNTIRVLVNELIVAYIESGECHNKMMEALVSRRLTEDMAYIDFRDLFLSKSDAIDYGGVGDSPYGSLVRLIVLLLQQELMIVDPETGLSNANDVLIAPITEAMSGEAGSVLFAGSIFSENIRIKVGNVDAVSRLAVSDIRLKNLDTLGDPLDLLELFRGEPFVVSNEATLGLSGRPTSIGVTIDIEFDAAGKEKISNKVEVTVSLDTASALITTMLNMGVQNLAEFEIGNIINLDCWLATMPAPPLNEYGVRLDGVLPSASLTELSVAISELKASVTCIECSSPGFEELAEILLTAEATEDLTDLVNSLFEYYIKLSDGSFVQVVIDRYLNDAHKRCSHSRSYKANAKRSSYKRFKTETTERESSFVILIGAITICVIACAVLGIKSLSCFVQRRNHRWMKKLPDAQVLRLHEEQIKEQKREDDLNAATHSMFNSPQIPFAVRVSIPIFILGNIALFLSGHLSVGGTVFVALSLGGQSVEFDSLYDFSIYTSTLRMWEAGGRELAILILIFSGIWPYTKQLISLTLWFLPTETCSISLRGSIFMWLDTLAKWSMLDIFVLVITLAAFRLSVESPDISFLPPDFYSVEFLVVLKWGLYANMIAQLVSQVSSHVIIYYHRKIVRHALKKHMQTQSDKSVVEEWDQYGNKKERLNGHSFARPHRGQEGKLVVRRFVSSALVVVGIVQAILVVVGVVLPSVELEYFGLVGLAVESGQEFEAAVKEYSTLSISRVLFDQAKFLGGTNDLVGLGALSCLVILTVFVAPVLQVVCLLAQWFFPMTGKSRKKFMFFLESVQAWQYSEVYIIALVVSSWQLRPISMSLGRGFCRGLRDTLSNLVYFGILNAEDGTCFTVEATVLSAAYVLVASAIVLALLNTYVMKASEQYFRDRDAENDGQLNENLGVHSLDEEDCGAVQNIHTEDDNKKLSIHEKRMKAEQAIHPVPLLFSDRFRWTLLPESTSRPGLSAGNSNRSDISSLADDEVFEEAKSEEIHHPSNALLDIAPDSENKRVAKDVETKDPNLDRSYDCDLDQQLSGSEGKARDGVSSLSGIPVVDELNSLIVNKAIQTVDTSYDCDLDQQLSGSEGNARDGVTSSSGIPAVNVSVIVNTALLNEDPVSSAIEEGIIPAVSSEDDYFSAAEVQLEQMDTSLEC